MGYQINYEKYVSHFAIPSAIMEEIKTVDGDFLKIMLLILHNPTRYYSISLLSTLLELNEKIVAQAILFWTARGLLISDESVAGDAFTISDTVRAVDKPQPAANSAEITILLQTLEQMFARPISSTERTVIIGIYQKLNLPIDVIIMVFQYCMMINKLSVNYAESVCSNWAQNGITTHAQAEAHLKALSDRHSNENQVKTCFGIDNRNLSDNEQQMVVRWFGDFGYDIAIIAAAFERTVNAIGKVSFPYTNRILESWHEKGLTTLEEVQSGNNNRKSNMGAKASYDIEELDKYWDDIPKL